ncbi:MAG: zinc-dependent metalloprotease [Bacteroidetes bacterium]|nr:zinc-dependent metalloprotease [Bacteroidota bacterium]
MRSLFLQRFIFFLLMWFSFGATAQNEGSVLSAFVKQALGKGVKFHDVTLFDIGNGTEHKALQSETILSVKQATVTSLYNNKPEAVSVSLTTSTHKLYKLELLKCDAITADANFGVIENGLRKRTSFDAGLHYQGAVAGREQSLATMSVFADGTVMILFATSEGNFVVGKLEDGSGNYILYNDKDFLNRPYASCGVNEKSYKNVSLPTGNKTTAAYGCHKVKLYWEADFDLFQDKGTVVATQNYLSGLFNEVQALYRNERIALELKSVYVWTTNDGYASSTSDAALFSFQGKWNLMNDTFDGDIAHLIAKDSLTEGVAYVDKLCDRPNAYGYSSSQGTYQTIPTFSWDVEVVAHETGHLLGSPHTHWCGWMTAPGGNCGAIDSCIKPLENSSTCAFCNYAQFDGSLPNTSWQGTIMSYCQFTSRTTNLANGFGTLPGNLIRTKVSAAPCLSSIISASLATTQVCKYDGSVIVSYNTDNFGTAPFSYYWSNNKTTQNLLNLNVPGTFTVLITDSNGCSKSYTATVTRNTADTCYPAGINNISKGLDEINIYPNPATKQVTLKFNAYTTGNTEVEVTDILGKVVFKKELSYTQGSNSIVLDVSSWSKGVYYLSIDNNNSKLIVQ